MERLKVFYTLTDVGRLFITLLLYKHKCFFSIGTFSVVCAIRKLQNKTNHFSRELCCSVDAMEYETRLLYLLDKHKYCKSGNKCVINFCVFFIFRYLLHLIFAFITISEVPSIVHLRN